MRLLLLHSYGCVGSQLARGIPFEQQARLAGCSTQLCWGSGGASCYTYLLLARGLRQGHAMPACASMCLQRCMVMSQGGCFVSPQALLVVPHTLLVPGKAWEAPDMYCYCPCACGLCVHGHSMPACFWRLVSWWAGKCSTRTSTAQVTTALLPLRLLPFRFHTCATADTT
jgi:hypothetical protein